MKLSDAITYGSTLRGESHSGPFIRVANSDDLLSDVYGAACEAIYSPITKERNWNLDNGPEYRTDIEYLRTILHRHFDRYFQVAVTCPGADRLQYSVGGGRFTGRVVGGLNEVAVEGEKVRKARYGVTTACPSIINFVEYLEHMFYVHNWSREQCAQAAEFVEQGETRQLSNIFEHYPDESLRRRTAQKLTVAARQREQQRHARRRIYATN